MFTTTTESNGRNALAFTGQLTTMSDSFASDIMAIMAKDEDKYTALVEQSKTDINGLDVIIKESTVLDKFFEEKQYNDFTVDADEAIKILKSQQSKRSRSKSKDLEVFTHFKNYLSAYIAEKIIRKIAAIEGTGHSGPRVSFSFEPYTEDELAVIKLDQYSLSNLIRNIQSRKCTFKKNPDENAVALEQLAVKEEQLKSIRDGSVKMNRNAEFTKLQELFTDVDIDKIKLADARILLQAIVELF